MTETRLRESIDAIVARLKAAGMTVWDGPILTGDYVDAVYIGYDGMFDGGEEKASSTDQAWAGSMGQRKRDEELHIVCSIVTLTGNETDSWKPVRDKTFALLDTVGEMLRTDPSLGLAPPSVAELWPGDYYQETGPAGMQARIVFVIHHKTRV